MHEDRIDEPPGSASEALTQDTLGPLSIRRRGAGAVETTVEGRELKLSNLDKVLYPQTGFTKGDLIAYYAARRRSWLALSAAAAAMPALTLDRAARK